MRTISRTTQFKKDYKRKVKGQHRETLAADFTAVVELLATDAPLPACYNDHPLVGRWKGYRDLHV